MRFSSISKKPKNSIGSSEYFKKIVLLLATIFNMSFSNVGTTTESVNPFNEFMNPKGGVSLFSGDVAFPIELFKLPGRNGMDISIAFRYSSNIYNQVRGRNDISPTSWVGLGWSFGFGSISCDHKNTMILTDDDYYWVSADGVRKEIIDNYIEDNPYWKVEKIVENSTAFLNSRVKGWILTDPSGQKFKYGAPSATNAISDTRFATRYTYCWPNSKYVGEGFGGSPELYPSQWDLSEIVDIYGNTNNFEYDTIAEALKCAVNSSNPSQTKYYTKASYLKKITNPQGDYILFETEFKGDPDEIDVTEKCNEYYDPHTLKDEPDGFLELYETKRLKKIKVYQSNSLIKQAVLCYKQISPLDDSEKSYLKSLLQSIMISNGEGTKIEKTVFKYYDDPKHEIDENYHFGAIDSIIFPKCSKVKLNYKKQTLNNVRYCLEYDNCVADSMISGGTLNDGKEFVVRIQKLNNDSGEVMFNWWNGSVWKKNNIIINHSIFMPKVSETGARIACGDGFAIIHLIRLDDIKQADVDPTKPGTELNVNFFSNIIIPFVYNTETDSFEQQTIKYAYTLFRETQVSVNNKTYFLSNDISIENGTWTNSSKVYRLKKNREWHITTIIEKQTFNFNLGNDFFVIWTDPFMGTFQNYAIYRWSGNEWLRSPKDNGQYHQLNKNAGKSITTGDKYFVINYKPDRKEYADIFTWNGEGWNSERYEVKYGKDMQIYAGNNYFSIAHQAHNDVSAYTWNGERWYNSLIRVNCGDRDRYDHQLKLKSGFDFFVESHPMWIKGDGTNKRIDERFGIHYWNNNKWYTNNTRLGLDYRVQKKFSTSYGATVGSLWKNSWDNWQWEFKFRAGIWDGSKWNESDIIHERDEEGRRIKFPEPHLIGKNLYAQKLSDGSTEGKLYIFNRYQDQFSKQIFAFACTSKIVYDGTTGEKLTSYYNYNPSSDLNMFNTITGSLEFERVAVGTTIGDSTIYHFHCGVDNPYEGLIFKTESKNSSNEIVTKDSIVYEKYPSSTTTPSPDWPEGIYQKRVVERYDTLNGVGTYKKYEYNNTNGEIKYVG